MNNYWKSRFAWSPSRQRTWDECRKRYWFTYIAGYERGNPELRDKVWELKKLTKMIFWKGNLIHEAVSQQIKRAKLGINMGIKSAEMLIAAEVAGMKKGKANKFVEIVNGFEIADGDFDLVLEEAKHQVGQFFELWPRWEGVEIVVVEENEIFDLDGVPVNMKIDFQVKTFDEVFINVDWKTGKTREEETDNSEAIGTYILGTMIKNAVSAEAVSGELIYLRSGKIFPTFRTDEQIQELRSSIIKRGKIMLSVRDEKDLPASPGKYRCRDCQFATICDEGKGYIGAAAIAGGNHYL